MSGAAYAATNGWLTCSADWLAAPAGDELQRQVSEEPQEFLRARSGFVSGPMLIGVCGARPIFRSPRQAADQANATHDQSTPTITSLDLMTA
jgi:hypothetical protein